MPDVNGWPLACFALAALIYAANYFYEKGSDK